MMCIVFAPLRSVVISALLVLCCAGTLLAQAPPAPVVSPSAGFFTAPVQVSIAAASGDSVFYTLDGSVPDTASFLYSSPLLVNDRADDTPVITWYSNISNNYAPWNAPVGPVQLVTVLRARTRRGGEWGAVATHTYIVHPEGVARYSLPVVSLTTNKENLFDYNTGIYVLGRYYDQRANPGAADAIGTPANYTQRGDDWERPAHMELFEPGGLRGLAMDIGIRIHGGGSRQFAQKSFRLYSRSDYGTSRFRYRIFPNQELENYNRLILRNSGQDWMKTMLRDGFVQTLFADMPFETMAFRPSVLFLNGEFWGIANIRERYDRHYLSIKYGIPDTRIDYLSGNRSVVEGSAAHYNAMMSYVAGGVTSSERFAYVQTQMDVDDFMYYNLANIFVNNRDWPHNNIDFWRYNAPISLDAGPGRDGRWRWMMFDTDFSFAWTDIHRETTYLSHVRENSLVRVSRADHWSTQLLRSLLTNKNFEVDFINTYRDLVNSTLSATHVTGVLDSLSGLIAPHIQEHIERWGNSTHRWSMPKEVAEWYTNLEYIRRFANERAEQTDEHFKAKFNLGDLYTLHVSVNDTTMGHVRVHRLDIRAGTPGVGDFQYPEGWTGRYFQGNRVNVTAVPRDGYRFVRWMNGQSVTDTVIANGLIGRLVAIFEPIDTAIDGPSTEVPPVGMQLHPNYPNPFNPSTTVHFTVGSRTDFGQQPTAHSRTRLAVYDMVGREVAVLVDDVLVPGAYSVRFDAAGLASGVYVVRLEGFGEQQTRKISLIR